MAVRLSKPWLSAAEALKLLRGNLGVFEFADADGTVLYIGYAGGLSQFGLKGVVAEALQQVEAARLVSYEITTAYHTRYRELLMAYQADHGCLPPANPSMKSKLGNISPA